MSFLPSEGSAIVSVEGPVPIDNGVVVPPPGQIITEIPLPPELGGPIRIPLGIPTGPGLPGQFIPGIDNNVLLAILGIGGVLLVAALFGPEIARRVQGMRT